MALRPILPIVLLFATALSNVSQAQSTSDCSGSIPLCGGIYTEESAPLGTGNVYEFTGTCNASLETSSLWYTFVVEEAGTISFTIDPADDADDYDWGMFNITNGGCEGITAQDGSSPEVNCNSYGNFGDNGPTGISSGQGGTGVTNGPGNTNGPAFNADLPVQAGETYALVVMNWSNSLNGYTIDFTESTASIFDSTIPSMVEAVADCENLNLHVEFSEPMVTSTVVLTDFTLSTLDGTGIPLANVEPDQAAAYSQTGFNIGLVSGIQQAGVYELHITSTTGNVEDVCGNLVIDTSLQVTIAEPLQYEVNISPACNAVNGTVMVEHLGGGVEPLTYTLNGVAMPDGIATGLSLGSYILTIADAGGCEIERPVSVPNHAINLQIEQQQDSLSCSTPTVTIEGVTIQPFQTVQYVWSAVTSAGTIPEFSASEAPQVSIPGTYQLTVTEPVSGCTDQASVEIRATSGPTVDLDEILIPNVVSPNADGQNDVWRPYVLSDPDVDITGLFDEYSLTIFNRWGQVMHTSDGGSRSWNAREAADGTYFYSLAYRAECGAVVDDEHTGTITVLR